MEADLFGEEDTRSSMMRLVSQRLTNVINVPNVKDHGATGATRRPDVTAALNIEKPELMMFTPDAAAMVQRPRPRATPP